MTTCGVLNLKNCQPENSVRDNASNGDRRLSLTKYQIDSSEYIQSKVFMRSYTDYEKAMHNEYKLNIFSPVSSHISTETSPGQTDDEIVTYGDDEPISIKTALSKNDWIQEWAKNARRCREREPASSSPRQHIQSLHSQNKYHNPEVFYDDAFFDQFGGGIIDDSGDESPTKTTEQKKNWNTPENYTLNSGRRPPISSTKIPSPMHTHLRARSSSANRSYYHNNAVSSFQPILFKLRILLWHES